MENLNINAELRNTEEKVSEVRSSKKVPGVVYGHKQESIALKVDNSDLLRTYRVAGESHIINLNLDGKTIEVLIHDLQKHPITGEFTHVDFFAITKGEKLTTKIHLNFTGVSAAVKEGAILEELHKEIEVKCLPKDLVDAFDVDLSKLAEMGDNIKVEDLAIDSAKYEIITPAEEVIAIAAKPKVQVEETEEATTEETTEEEAK